MDYLRIAAPPLDHAAVRAHSRALAAASIEIRQESRDAIETSKVRVARSRIELARLRETCRRLVVSRMLPGGRSGASSLGVRRIERESGAAMRLHRS